MVDRSLFKLPKIGMAMGVMLLIALAQAACLIGQAYAVARAITNLWEGSALSSQMGLLGAFAGCFAGKQALIFARDTFLARFAAVRAEELRSSLLARVFGSQLGLVSQHGSAAITQAALEGADQVENYIGIVLPKLVELIAIPVPILVAAFLLDWVSSAIMLVLFPIIIFFMVILGRQASAKAAAQYETYNALSNHFIDTLRGIETLKVFGQSKKAGGRIFKVSEDFRYATIDTLKTATLSSAVLDLIATLGIAAVAMMLGFRLLDGSMALFPALMALVLAPDYFNPIREFASDFHASLDGKNALADITRIIASAQAGAAEDRLPSWGARSSLRFADVSFSYPSAGDVADDAPFALEGIAFEAQGFQKVGIVGVSGSGKSTLVSLLGGFADPAGGSIQLDGVPASTLQQPSWQSQLLYIPQDPYVFHATLRDNIAFYSPEADDAQIRRAIEVCGLEKLLAQLPDGLDTVIGEGGRALSGGQAQRIALARALLDPSRKVLLFDEPTAHLDIETELELKERMLPLMEGRLVFFATHRLHWLEEFDYILVLDHGKVAEAGTLDELLQSKGKLFELACQMNEGGAA